MNINQVKTFMNKIVYYDTGQMDMEGCSVAAKPSARMGSPCEQSERGGGFYLTACILRQDKKN